MRLLNFHILSLSVRMLSLQERISVVFVQWHDVQTTKHTTPLHRTIVVTFFSVLFSFFFFFRCSLSFTCFLYQINKQANNVTTIEYTNYFCWFNSPCRFEFSIVYIRQVRIFYIQHIIMYCGFYLLFVVLFLSLFLFLSSFWNIHMFKRECRWFY